MEEKCLSLIVEKKKKQKERKEKPMTVILKLALFMGREWHMEDRAKIIIMIGNTLLIIFFSFVLSFILKNNDSGVIIFGDGSRRAATKSENGN